jgi:ABC-type Fe3+/spermidine/putrescine transport system ATPase subunit
MAEIRLDGISRRFDDVVAVDDVSLTVREGEVLALLGPSGCGKTTLLRIVSGLTEASSGTVYLDGKAVNHVPVNRRNVGMLFQNYALFPHLTVAQNVAFGLTVRLRARPRAAVRAAVARALSVVQLAGFDGRYPSQLSGGQQQRVAFARAIVTEPAVLLLDEPFGALDRRLREDMQVEVKRLVKQLKLTTILVTHDQDEAMTMADSVAVMRGGRIIQRGTARELTERPATRFIAEFIGPSNIFAGTFRRGEDGHWLFAAEDGISMRPDDGACAGGPGLVSIRPERIRLRRAAPGDSDAAPNAAFGTLAEVSYRAATRVCTVALATGRNVTIVESGNRGIDDILPGGKVRLDWDAASVAAVRED